MMTPSELREYEFKGAGRNAYKSDDVDNFFGEVAVAYEKLFRENAEYAKRIGLLADRLEQFKNDEDQIKQAILGAQKAADVIIKEAEASVEDAKNEAEAILAAAKGEADIIKSDAEKQAIADSELLLALTRDKAEEIINKAKEEARDILLEANKVADDAVGAANRTITSESIHFEMLKKEVSEFRASILAQYKAHIEMISKLPELAIEQAEKSEESAPETEVEIIEEIASVDPDNDIIEFIDQDEEDFSNNFKLPENDEESDGEVVIKTTLPFDFFEEDTPLEFVESEESDDSDENEVPSDIFDFDKQQEEDEGNIEFINSENEDVDSSDDETDTETDSDSDSTTETDTEDAVDDEDEEDEPADVPISRGFSVNTSSVSDDIDVFSDSNKEGRPSIFDSFGTIEDDEDEEEAQSEDTPKKKFGFFRRNK